MEFHCVACNYKAQKRANYIRHLETEKHKRNVSKSTMSDEDLDLRNLVMEMKTQINIIQEENMSLKNRVQVLESSLMNSKGGYTNCKVNQVNNTNNTFNAGSTNINIEVKPFGNESWKHLTNDTVLEIMRGVNNCVPELIKKLHFDTSHGENNNVRVPNKKLDHIETFNGVKWEQHPKKDTIDTWIHNSVDKLENEYGEEFRSQASEFLRELWSQKYQIITDVNDKEHKKEMRKTRKEVECVLLSNRDEDNLKS